jgi:hypothetical protein
MRRPLLIPVTLLLLFLGGAASARVFENLGRVAQPPAGSQPGWSLAYSARWTLNGSRAEVEVWSASEPLAAALDHLRAEASRQGDIAAFLPGSAMAWGAVGGHGRMARFLCKTSESGRQTLVFRFSQSEADFHRTVAGPAEGGLPDSLRAPPGARPVFTAANEDSGTTIAVFTADGTPGEACAFMAESLAGNGWSPALGKTGSIGPMGFYLRRDALCGFSAKMSGHDGSCVVTVLHRRLKTGD